jgi:hypothetical protein
MLGLDVLLLAAARVVLRGGDALLRCDRELVELHRTSPCEKETASEKNTARLRARTSDGRARIACRISSVSPGKPMRTS